MYKSLLIAVACLGFGVSSAGAFTAPPAEPTYDRPDFSEPEKPAPERPDRPKPPGEPERRTKNLPPPKQYTPPVDVQGVECYEKDGQFYARYLPNMSAEDRKMGRDFCQSLHPRVPAAAKCITESGVRRIEVSPSLGKYNRKRAAEFCKCVWED